MPKPQVSVIIPLYNSIAFLEETLASVLNQTYDPIEIVVVDDGSTDGSYELAKTYVSKGIRVVKNKIKGACSARNYGIQLSSGQYLQFLDADDLISPEKIEKQVEVLKDHPNAIAVSNTYHFKEDLLSASCTDQEYVFSTDKPEELFIKLWGGYDHPLNMIQTSAWLVPRQIVEKFGLWNENLAKDQDGEFFARLGLNSEAIIYTPNVKNYYRKHNTLNNIASKTQRIHLESNLLATHLKKTYLFSKSKSTSAKKAIATLYKQVAIDAWPIYKDISRESARSCKVLGGTDHNPVLGGRIIETTKSLFGWRIAKSISYYGHKIM